MHLNASGSSSSLFEIVECRGLGLEYVLQLLQDCVWFLRLPRLWVRARICAAFT